MNTCLFLTFKSGSAVATDELAQLTGFLRATPKLTKALLHTPASTSDPYVKDEPSPSLVLQLYFAELTDLEASASRSGCLQALTSRNDFPGLAQAEASQQAMLVRPFAVPDPALRTPPGEPYCTYLVSYEGEAEDLNAWHSHYLENHTRRMAMFSGIRELEVYTRLDWISAQPWRRLNFMQRNKVAFDSPAALKAALNSPVRHEMRADFKTFSAFSGPNTHFAMATHRVQRSRISSATARTLACRVRLMQQESVDFTALGSAHGRNIPSRSNLVPKFRSSDRAGALYRAAAGLSRQGSRPRR